MFDTLARWFFSLSILYPILGRGEEMAQEDVDFIVEFFTTRKLYENVSSAQIERIIRSIRVQQSRKNFMGWLFFTILKQAGTVGFLPNDTVYLNSSKAGFTDRTERLPLLVHEIGHVLDQRLKYGWFTWIRTYLYWMLRFKGGINHPLEIAHYKNGREVWSILHNRDY